MTIRRALPPLMIVLLAATSGACGGSRDDQVASASRGPSSSAASSSPPTTSPSRSSAAQQVSAYISAQRAWVTCMRKHGAEVSDPDENGQTTYANGETLRGADPRKVAFIQASITCQDLVTAMPESVRAKVVPKLTARQLATTRSYARCMQTSGAPDFPDPDAYGIPARPDGSPLWRQGTTAAQNALRKCSPLVGGLGSGGGVG